MKYIPCGGIGVTSVYNVGLRKYNFRGQWSAPLRNRWWSKKTERLTVLKSGVGSLAVGSYFQRGSAPPPPPRNLEPRVQK